MSSALDVQGLKATFDHAAVAAPRLRSLLPLYQDLLGGEFVYGGDNPRVGYRAIQLRYEGGDRVELMEPLRGSDFFATFFRVRPTGGLHHLTFTVPDVRKAMEVMRDRGFSPVAVHLESAHWKEAFLHPREAHGVLIQVAEKGPESDSAARFDGLTLDDVLAGHGPMGDAVPSP